MTEASFRPEAPFTTTTEWYDYMKAVTPDSLQYYLKDSFENITLYSNKVKEASYKKRDDGKFEVTIAVESVKSYFDGNGKLLDSPKSANYLDVAVFGEDSTDEDGITSKTPLFIEKQWITPGESSITMIVNQKPVKAGIDPYNKMIDRIPDDNLLVLEEITD